MHRKMRCTSAMHRATTALWEGFVKLVVAVVLALLVVPVAHTARAYGAVVHDKALRLAAAPGRHLHAVVGSAAGSRLAVGGRGQVRLVAATEAGDLGVHGRACGLGVGGRQVH